MSSILPENELENFNFCPSLVGQKFFVRFLEELKKTKSPFEINSHLGSEIGRFCLLIVSTICLHSGWFRKKLEKCLRNIGITLKKVSEISHFLNHLPKLLCLHNT